MSQVVSEKSLTKRTTSAKINVALDVYISIKQDA